MPVPSGKLPTKLKTCEICCIQILKQNPDYWGWIHVLQFLTPLIEVANVAFKVSACNKYTCTSTITLVIHLWLYLLLVWQSLAKFHSTKSWQRYQCTSQGEELSLLIYLGHVYDRAFRCWSYHLPPTLVGSKVEELRLLAFLSVQIHCHHWISCGIKDAQPSNRLDDTWPLRTYEPRKSSQGWSPLYGSYIFDPAPPFWAIKG